LTTDSRRLFSYDVHHNTLWRKWRIFSCWCTIDSNLNCFDYEKLTSRLIWKFHINVRYMNKIRQLVNGSSKYLLRIAEWITFSSILTIFIACRFKLISPFTFSNNILHLQLFIVYVNLKFKIRYYKLQLSNEVLLRHWSMRLPVLFTFVIGCCVHMRRKICNVSSLSSLPIRCPLSQ
jgi:hypothetical protein